MSMALSDLRDLRDLLFGPREQDLLEAEEEVLKPDPLDDYSLLTNREVWIRSSIRGFLISGLMFSAGVLVFVLVHMLDVLSPVYYLVLCSLVVLVIAGFYLSLVHYDTGRWVLFHPLIPVAIKRFRERSFVGRIAGLLYFLLIGCITVFALAGGSLLERGWDFFFVFFGGIIFLNMLVLYGLSVQDIVE